MNTTTEHMRLVACDRGEANWKLWGPYLSERAWGTVREDYSPDGTAWDYLSHDQARSKAYRWNEDGLAGISDDEQRLCFALAFWNGHDPILKERFFGLTGSEGNHGEDVKEYYYYLDSTPTHSYMKMLYKYPQAAFPYSQLVEENARRGKNSSEYELFDTGVFDADRYFDVFVEYAKVAPDDILIRVSATNRGPEAAILHVLPTLWFRNTWTWGRDQQNPLLSQPPSGREDAASPGDWRGTSRNVIQAQHPSLGNYYLYCENAAEILFTNNETNAQRLYGVSASSPYVKDGFHEYIIQGNRAAINPDRTGTKAAAHYISAIDPGATATMRLRLRSTGAGMSNDGQIPSDPFATFDVTFSQRIREADEFYANLQHWADPRSRSLDQDLCRVQRQALAGMLWSKQFYHYDIDEWLAGDPAQPAPPPQRRQGRNAEWIHLNTYDIISMPDKWEYPWFATWDLAFHLIPLSLVDSQFAKDQLILLLREWYQHPNGQIPAYEWAFGDVNPPVFAWAAWRVYKIDQKQSGTPDRDFLERVFHKLLLNFTWWVNRKDSEGKNVFQGGFLGLDNIGVFDRSTALPTGGHIEQSDGTSWMAMFSLNMMVMALELARTNRVYEDIATKFFEHFLYIAAAMNNIAGEGIGLWDEEDEFFYDVLHLPDGTAIPLKVRSLVGLIPLFAVETIEPELLETVPEFKQRLEWFLENRPHLARLVSRWQEPGMGARRLLALVRGHRMKRLLKRALDPAEFLSDYGIRSISRYHAGHPYVLNAAMMENVVRYEPAESHSGLFGGNSNWRGPIWFPINYLIIESLQKFHHYYGDDFKVECPTGSGTYLTLDEIAAELSQRLTRIFLRDHQGRRPFYGENAYQQQNPHWRDYTFFNEYFHGDNGAGLGASHQTGWTGLVAKLIQRDGEHDMYRVLEQETHVSITGERIENAVRD
ncbi:MAG: glucosidase [Chloroflexi bacterium]|nr:glucosidase [Chloroflexota bacterium]